MWLTYIDRQTMNDVETAVTIELQEFSRKHAYLSSSWQKFDDDIQLQDKIWMPFGNTMLQVSVCEKDFAEFTTCTCTDGHNTALHVGGANGS